MYGKINFIDNSYFTDEHIKFHIKSMYAKINEIKVWKEEPENNNNQSKKRFKKRIDNIYKTINLFKKKHLEYIGSTIIEDKDGKWVKMNNQNSL
jgi:hypothetical protein